MVFSMSREGLRVTTRLAQHVPAAIHYEASQLIANEIERDINEAIKVFNKPQFNVHRQRRFTYVIMTQGNEPQGAGQSQWRISHLKRVPNETLMRQLQLLLPRLTTDQYVLSDVQLIGGAEPMCAYCIDITSPMPIH